MLQVTIPQPVCDWYNTHFSNSSYRAFGQALNESAQYGQLSDEQTNGEFIEQAMNLLINASLERSGATYYQNAENELIALIEQLDSRLLTLARLHLTNFDKFTQEKTEQALLEARTSAEVVARQASDLQSWRGRVAYAWISAATFLLHAAYAVLTDQTNEHYTLEKVGRAFEHLKSGMNEAEQNHWH